jgi:hypothetical protein
VVAADEQSFVGGFFYGLSRSFGMFRVSGLTFSVIVVAEGSLSVVEAPKPKMPKMEIE